MSSHLVLDGFVTTEAVLDVGDDSEVMLNLGCAAKLNRKHQSCSSARSPLKSVLFLAVNQHSDLFVCAECKMFFITLSVH